MHVYRKLALLTTGLLFLPILACSKNYNMCIDNVTPASREKKERHLKINHTTGNDTVFVYTHDGVLICAYEPGIFAFENPYSLDISAEDEHVRERAAWVWDNQGRF
jgi:hypothetical protein